MGHEGLAAQVGESRMLYRSSTLVRHDDQRRWRSWRVEEGGHPANDRCFSSSVYDGCGASAVAIGASAMPAFCKAKWMITSSGCKTDENSTDASDTVVGGNLHAGRGRALMA
eukprot:215646-Pleurochrysis_carterae.AAC.1